MKGKEKCRILKEIRAQIAEANGIRWVTENCAHKGECRGTCPKCESEVRALEREIERRRMLGKTVILAGISASMIVSTMGCEELIEQPNEVNGDMVIPETTTVPQISGDVPYDEGMEVDGDYAEVFPYLSDFESVDEVTYVANDSFYCEYIEDAECPEDFQYALSEGDVFTVIGYSSLWQAYLVRLEDGTLTAVYKSDIDNKSAVLPAEDTSENE